MSTCGDTLRESSSQLPRVRPARRVTDLARMNVHTPLVFYLGLRALDLEALFAHPLHKAPQYSVSAHKTA